MKRRLIKVIKGEKGQALPIVLVLMLVGGLLIAPSLSYASTSLNAGQVVEKNVNGLYAADAGVEYALWHIVDGSKMPGKKEKLNVNQLEVEVGVDPKIDGKKKGKGKDFHTIYYGELTDTGDHYYSLAVYGEMELIEEETYKYTIFVTWQPESEATKINLEEVGVRLPVGYSYQSGSAEGFEDNLFAEEPDDPIEQDQAGAYMLNWKFVKEPGKSRPYVSSPDFPGGEGPMPIRTQTFYVTDVTGEGELEGDYTWVGTHAHPSIGQVGEMVGKKYTIEAKAKVPKVHGKHDEEIAIVKACVLREEVEEGVVIHIISWQITHTKEKKGK